MLLKDIFNQLSHGEFAQTNIGSSINGGEGIQPDHYPVMVNFINLGLTELHKRFPLKTREILLQQYESIEYYRLTSKFATSNVDSLEPIKYIVDDEYPFKDDLLKIETIVDEAECELVLNNKANPFSLFTPEFNLLQVPYADSDKTLSIMYRANHYTLQYESISDPLTQEINLPVSHLEALLFYVAGRYFSSFPDVEGTTNQGIQYMTRFENSCILLQNKELTNYPDESNNKLELRGWA